MRRENVPPGSRCDATRSTESGVQSACGDQAVLVVIASYYENSSKPVQFKERPENGAVVVTELFEKNDYSRNREPDSTVTRVYRVTLKADSYQFTASDFSNLPQNYKFPELRIYRDKE